MASVSTINFLTSQHIRQLDAQVAGLEPGNAGEAQAPPQALDMEVESDAVSAGAGEAARRAADEANELVDAVAEEEAAVEDADRRGRLVDETAVEPDGAGPRRF